MAASRSVDHAARDDAVEIFGAPVLLGGRRDARVGCLGSRHRRAPRSRRRAACATRGAKVGVRHGSVDQQRFGGAADAGAPQLGIQHERLGPVEIGAAVERTGAQALRDGRRPARAPPLRPAPPAPCRRAARSRRGCRRARPAWRPTAARSRVGTSVMAASGRPAPRRPSTRQAWMARDGDGSSPSRRAGCRRCRP